MEDLNITLEEFIGEGEDREDWEGEESFRGAQGGAWGVKGRAWGSKLGAP